MMTRYAHLRVQNPRINVDTGKSEDWSKLIRSSFQKTWYLQGLVILPRGLKVCNSRSCVYENGKNSRNLHDTHRKITQRTSKCTKIGEAAKRCTFMFYVLRMLVWLAEVDSVFFINSVSGICVMFTKSTCFIEDEDQRLRVVVDLMLRETLVKGVDIRTL